MRAYLARLGAPPGSIQRLVARFRTKGYLDDAAYALRWARARLARRPMGRERLAAELMGQGLQEAVIASTLDRVYADMSELELARRLLSRRRGGPALLRRYGFSEETIEAVSDDVWRSSDLENDQLQRNRS